MTQHLIPDHGPHIATATTGNLLDQLDRLARRHADVVDTIRAIREGDNETLHELVRRTKAGDSDAALIAIGALLPRLCKVVINRRPPNRWKPTIDEYLTLAFLTIADVPASESSVYLAEKLLARTRLRHERQLVAPTYLPVSELDFTPERGPAVDEQALARLELRAVGEYLRAGGVRRDDISDVTLAAVGAKLGRPRTEAERKHLSRARRRLSDGYAEFLSAAA